MRLALSKLKINNWHKLSFPICLFIILSFVVFRVYSDALNFFFWKDDWFFRWTGNFNREYFFSGYVVPPIFRFPEIFLHTLIKDSTTWIQIGLFIKIINSFLIYYLVNYVLKDSKSAIFSSLLYAVYSGGNEAYTWVILTGVVVTFIICTLLFSYKYTKTKKISHLIYVLFFIFLSNIIYLGRATGVIVFLFLQLYCIRQKIKVQ
jgi:hypothetical protein